MNINHCKGAVETLKPHSKKWKAGFRRSSSATLTSEKSFACKEVEKSSIEKGMLHPRYIKDVELL